MVDIAARPPRSDRAAPTRMPLALPFASARCDPPRVVVGGAVTKSYTHRIGSDIVMPFTAHSPAQCEHACAHHARCAHYQFELFREVSYVQTHSFSVYSGVCWLKSPQANVSTVQWTCPEEYADTTPASMMLVATCRPPPPPLRNPVLAPCRTSAAALGALGVPGCPRGRAMTPGGKVVYLDELPGWRRAFAEPCSAHGVLLPPPAPIDDAPGGGRPVDPTPLLRVPVVCPRSRGRSRALSLRRGGAHVAVRMAPPSPTVHATLLLLLPLPPSPFLLAVAAAV